MAEFELTKDGEVLETHSTLFVCQVAAIEKGLVAKINPNWRDDIGGLVLVDGAKIEWTKF